MTVLCLLVLIYFIFNITSIVNVFILNIEKKPNFSRLLKQIPQKSFHKHDFINIIFLSSQLVFSLRLPSTT